MPQRLAARALDDWRMAERLMDRVPPSSADYETLQTAIEDLRRVYRELSEQAAQIEVALGDAEALIVSWEQLLADLRGTYDPPATTAP